MPNSTECIACNASGLPAHAVPLAVLAPDGVRCDWACDADYLRIGASCVLCPQPACAPGTYEAACNASCAACVAPTNNTVFTGPGAARFANNSCPYECAPGFFQLPLLPNQPARCAPCAATACTAGFFKQACTSQSDARCVRCRPACVLGENATAACAPDADLQCAPCAGVLPRGATWLAGCAWACPAAFNPDAEGGPACVPCAPVCTAGQFATQCAARNNWTGCEACALPLGALALSAGAGTNNSCVWACAPGASYAAGACVVSAVEPSPPLCVRPRCGPGLAVAANCSCVACAAELPPGAVWLSSFVTSAECAWACLPPLTAQGGACVAAFALAPPPPPPASVPQRRALAPNPYGLLPLALLALGVLLLLRPGRKVRLLRLDGAAHGPLATLRARAARLLSRRHAD